MVDIWLARQNNLGQSCLKDEEPHFGLLPTDPAYRPPRPKKIDPKLADDLKKLSTTRKKNLRVQVAHLFRKVFRIKDESKGRSSKTKNRKDKRA